MFGMAASPSAASGRYSELSEWQRSADEEAFLKATKMPGTATGEVARAKRVTERAFVGEEQLSGATKMPSTANGNRWTLKNLTTVVVRSLCWHYLYSRSVKDIVCRPQRSTGLCRQKKSQDFS